MGVLQTPALLLGYGTERSKRGRKDTVRRYAGKGTFLLPRCSIG